MDRVLPYSSTSRPPERNKWLTYALNLKPRQRSQSHNRSLDEDNIIMQEPNSKPKQNVVKKNANKKPTQPKPLKADHSLQIFIPTSEETEDDDSIKQELLNAQLSRDFKKFPVYGNDSGLDDIDDSDPRLGIPEVKGNEQEVAARYHSRRSPSPYTLGKSKFVIKSRPQSAPLFGIDNNLRYVHISPRNVDSGNDKTIRENCLNEAYSLIKVSSNPSEGLPLHQQVTEKETSSQKKSSRTSSSSSNSTLSDTSYKSLVLSLEQNLLPQRNDFLSEKEHLNSLSNHRDVPQADKNVQYEDRIATPQNVVKVESDNRCCYSNSDVNINTVVGDDTNFNSCDNLLIDDTNYMTDLPLVKLSPFEHAGTGHRETDKKQEKNIKLTPYEAAMSLDDGGLSVEEIIESDSDNIYSAKKVFLHKPSKPGQGNLPNTQANSGLSVSIEDVPSSVNDKEIIDVTDTEISDESESFSSSKEQDDLLSVDCKADDVLISGFNNHNGKSDSEETETDHSEPSEKKKDNTESNISENCETNNQVTKEISETTETHHVTFLVSGHVTSDVTDHVTSNADNENGVINKIPDTYTDEKGLSDSAINSGKSDQRNPHIANDISGIVKLMEQKQHQQNIGMDSMIIL
ncbi:hypothetical protein KUTeg_021403 [Tegillarca granosa]|uniref:Uncharacterized protein n=1 Tax=Tegillarca granosa TaxID=220873 RepID=A0ABQ9E349_TEGGR|nr:hypothetical protein KUTeg_021403 [Tegillarca granosa]